MQNKILKTLMPRLVILFGAILIPITVTAQTQSSAPDFQTTQAAPSGDDCTIANQRLVKTLDALDKSENEKKTLEVENLVLKRLEVINASFLAAKDQMLKSKDGELTVLRNLKCSKTSFLFGLISKKTCY